MSCPDQPARLLMARLLMAPLSALECAIVECLQLQPGLTTYPLKATLEARIGEPIAEGKLKQLLARLVEVGVLRSRKGSRDGYRLDSGWAAREVSASSATG